MDIFYKKKYLKYKKKYLNIKNKNTIQNFNPIINSPKQYTSNKILSNNFNIKENLYIDLCLLYSDNKI
jgi:hypothetical protein